MSEGTQATVDAVVDALAETAPEIRAGLSSRRSNIDEENPSGEAQLDADVWADERLADALTAVDGVGAYLSEERADVLDIGEGVTVAVDPLDGSKNLQSSNCLGIILGVYEGSVPLSGRDLVAAAYVVFGPVTTLVTATDGTVTESVLESGTRRTVTEPVELPEDRGVYGVGGRRADWTEAFTGFVDELDSEAKCRYGGALVGDGNQVLTFGGVYAYPAVDGYPNGKLRVLFEAAPMAYVVETAGGGSSDGSQSLLEVTATALHQRTPVLLGDAELVARAAETV